MKRKTLVAVLVLLLFFGTTTAYAYWDRTQVTTPENNITIGVGTTLEVTETIGGTGEENLVPYGTFRGENDVYEVMFFYNIELNKQGMVHILAKDILIDGTNEYSDLIIIDIYKTAPNAVPTSEYTLTPTLNSDVYEDSVFVKVMLSMPQNETEYNAVAGKEISFTLEFSAQELTA